MRKEIIFTKVLLVLFAMLLPSTTWGENVVTDNVVVDDQTPVTSSILGGGSGTQDDPYLIKTAQDLIDFTTYVNDGRITNEYVKLAADIDCSSLTSFVPIGCSPIGCSEQHPFIGTFTGGTAENHYTIRNLTINSEDSYVGLFGLVGDDGSNAVIENLDLSNCTISGGYYTGAVAGMVRYNSKITNCTVSGSVISCSNSASAANTGGIVGKVSYSEISHCQVSSSTITAVSNATDDNATTITAGGIAGLNEVGNINYCEVKGSTKVTSNFSKSTMYVYGGAVIGWNNSDNTTTTQANVYESSVTTTVRGEEYKDQAPRGIGQEDGSCYDIFNQVMMAGTKKVTISATDLNGNIKVELGTIAANTYYFTETEGEGANSKLKALYTLPDNNMVLQVTSAPGYKPTLTLSDEAVEVTPTEAFENRIWTIQYAFKMPGDDVTATVAFTKDLAGLKEESTYIYDLETDNAYYTGEPIEPIISWTNANPDPVELTKGTDYEIKDFFEIKGGVATPMYQEDGTTPKAPVNVGSYKISITGKGNYSGTRELEFSICKGVATITAEDQTATYTGSPIGYDKSNITLSPETISKDGISFYYIMLDPDNPEKTISFDGAPIDAGTYTVKINLADDHYNAETVYATLTILPKDITDNTVTVSTDPLIYNGAIQYPKIKVEYGDITLTDDDYDASYTQDGKTVVGPASVGTYTLTIKGKDNYTGEITTEITVRPREIATKDIMVTLATTSYTYDGTAHTPGVSKVTISEEGGPIELGTEEYDTENIGYTNNINAALATATENAPTVTISLKGNYSGTGVATFTIEQADLSGYVVTGLATPETYTGSAITPTFAVKATENAETSLTANTDYSVKYQHAEDDVDEMKDAGAYKIIITGEGNYKGSLEKNFTIDRAQLNLTINLEGWTYGDTPNEPSLDGNLEEGDITWEYKAAGAEAYSAWSALTKTTDAGTYMVRATVAETINYEGGSKEAEFVIAQYDLANATVTLDNDELVYNGDYQTVQETVMAGDIKVPVDCYEVSGNTEKKVGNHKLIVTAKTKDSQGNMIKNNFKGSSKEINWKIKNRTVTANELGLSENQPQATYYSETEDLELPDGVIAYIITGVNGNNVVTQRVSYIPKGVAVLVESGTSTQTVNDEIPSQLPLKGTAVDLNVTSISGGTVYVLYKGEFVKSTTGTIPAKRCYLLLSNDVAAGTRAFGIIGGGSDGSTSIKSINDALSTTDKWYDMRGRRIEKPTKTGIYIKNGKIVVINNK